MFFMHSIENVNRLLRAWVDNWFDVKWLGFAGKKKVNIDTGISAIDSEVVPCWKLSDKVTIPPFTPNRIVSQKHFIFKDRKFNQAEKAAKPVHIIETRRSSENLKNRVVDFSESGLFIWFS